ncbi:hypothetical protein [Deinococcus hopiensis]|uniref:hypothetical protein n=1 Tax=Deinococcus hopiensis TaxID=309885 RepID=UPI00111C5933|nr:hypothetical protein [Deinococcus hopiensis]
MDSVDLGQLVSIVTKGGPAAMILAFFYGLAMLVREVRSGKVGDAEKANLAGEVAKLKAQVETLTEGMERMESELERALDLVHSMRYQRDQARIRVEFLEQAHNVDPRTVWPPEPGGLAPVPYSTPPEGGGGPT